VEEGADKLLLLAHSAATLFLVGLIWFVQVVHYPLLAQVGTGEFVAYAASHGQAWTARGGWVLYLLARAMRGGQW
jgi:hypothetical protein